MGPPQQYGSYYMNGLVPLSYLLPEDENLLAIRENYLGYVLEAQKNYAVSLGWLGPAPKNCSTPKCAGAEDYFGKYDMVRALEMHMDAQAFLQQNTSDLKRSLLEHHKAFLLALSTNDPPLVDGKWAFARYSDALAGIEWLTPPQY